MNKIAIFGDSFGQNCRLNKPKDLVEEYRSWIDLIETTHTYAQGGTDIQWSFLEFEKHHNDYDQIIFILTSSQRITLKDANTTKLLKLTVGGNAWEREEGSEEALKDNNIEAYHTWKALAELEKILIINNSYQERTHLFYSLTIERIKQIRPDVKFIAAFPLNDLQIPLMNNCLQDITDYENKIMKWKSVDNRHDTRIDHLTEESHIILASLIKKWLTTDEMFFDFNLKEFENVKPDIRKYNNG